MAPSGDEREPLCSLMPTTRGRRRRFRRSRRRRRARWSGRSRGHRASRRRALLARGCARLRHGDGDAGGASGAPRRRRRAPPVRSRRCRPGGRPRARRAPRTRASRPRRPTSSGASPGAATRRRRAPPTPAPPPPRTATPRRRCRAVAAPRARSRRRCLAPPRPRPPPPSYPLPALGAGGRRRLVVVGLAGAALDGARRRRTRRGRQHETHEHRAQGHQQPPRLRVRRCRMRPTAAARMTAQAMPSQPPMALPATAPMTAGPTAQHRTISTPPPTSARSVRLRGLRSCSSRRLRLAAERVDEFVRRARRHPAQRWSARPRPARRTRASSGTHSTRDSAATTASTRSRMPAPAAKRSSRAAGDLGARASAARPRSAISARRSVSSVALNEHAMGSSVGIRLQDGLTPATLDLEPTLKSRRISMDDSTLTIGQLAQRFGLNTSAIRYYEANGVLPEPPRVSGQRRYGPDAVRRLEVLEVAKRAGFTLDEARVLLQSAEAGTPAFESLRELAPASCPKSTRSSRARRRCGTGYSRRPTARAPPSTSAHSSTTSHPIRSPASPSTSRTSTATFGAT